MANKTEIAGISPAEKLRRFAAANKRWLRMGGTGLAGYIMSGCFLFGGVSPFGVAFCAALSGADAMGAAAGAVLGYLLSANMLANFKYMAAVALVLCAKWLFGDRAGKRWGVFSAVGTCLVCLGVCTVASFALSERTPYDAILTLAELFLACGTTYFFARAMEVLPMGLHGASRSDLSCVTVAGCVVLMGVTQVTVSGLSLGKVLGVLCILLCARKARESGGAVAGVAVGVSIGLAGGNYSYVIGAYALGGLVAGMFGRMGRIATAAAFIAVNTATALLTMDFLAVNNAIFEVFVSCLAFVAIPDSLTVRLRLESLERGGLFSEASTQAVLAQRLEDVSGALREIGETTRTVSRKLGEKKDPGLPAITERVAERVCARCGMKTSCWQLRGDVTRRSLEECLSLLRKEGAISKEQLPRHFQQHCCRMEELAGELQSQFRTFLARDGVQRKVSKVRTVLTDQFDGMATMLEELSAELSAAKPIEEKQAQRVLDYFTKQNVTPHRLSCTVDRFGRMAVELVVPGYQAARVGRTKASLDLCALLEVDFDMPEVTPREKHTTFTFCEKAAYSVELGAYQLASGGSRLCGDAYDYIRNRGGCAHFILSDGMGSGGAAAVDSAMACGLLVRLISVGVGYEAALKLVNSALLVKSGDESLATVDACSLDLFTGKARFYKAGAAPTFLIKGGKAGYVESASLPAGILHGVSFEESSVTLHEGDVVVMVSDGVTSTGSDWIKSELAAMKGDDMQRLSEKLAVTAKMRRTDGHEDDITVVAAALRKS